MSQDHTDRRYDAELQRVQALILRMGAKVEEILDCSMRSLVDQDLDLARRMIEFDRQINRLEVDIDNACLLLLARRQPMASDLRFIAATLKLVVDLERIGDLGVHICERVIELGTDPPLRPYVDLESMAEAVREMVSAALDAFVARDTARAEQVTERDKKIDAQYGQTFRELLTWMMEDPRTIQPATRLQSIAKYLERIGDHATNLAEQVVFMVEGMDIRHLGRLEEATPIEAPRGILFVSTHNAARSQMAEGWARRLLPVGVRVVSAGLRPAEEVNPYAVRVMGEVGIDISARKPKHLAHVATEDVDLLINLSDEKVHVLRKDLDIESWPMTDPATIVGTEEEILRELRAERDTLRARIEDLAHNVVPAMNGDAARVSRSEDVVRR
jgi:phosphate transport system protein